MHSPRPAHRGRGSLRVVSEDRVVPEAGFGIRAAAAAKVLPFDMAP